MNSTGVLRWHQGNAVATISGWMTPTSTVTCSASEKHWKRSYFWATHSRQQPVIDVARMIKHHYDGVMTFFAHCLTSATADGINSRIQVICVQALGYRNREHFKMAIYVLLGGPNLYPSAASAGQPTEIPEAPLF